MVGAFRLVRNGITYCALRAAALADAVVHHILAGIRTGFQLDEASRPESAGVSPGHYVSQFRLDVLEPTLLLDAHRKLFPVDEVVGPGASHMGTGNVVHSLRSVHNGRVVHNYVLVLSWRNTFRHFWQVGRASTKQKGR